MGEKRSNEERGERISRLKQLEDSELSDGIISALGRLTESNLPRIKAAAIEGDQFESTIDFQVDIKFSKGKIDISAGGEVRPSPWRKTSTNCKW